jgi:hypothetical protein
VRTLVLSDIAYPRSGRGETAYDKTRNHRHRKECGLVESQFSVVRGVYSPPPPTAMEQFPRLLPHSPRIIHPPLRPHNLPYHPFLLFPILSPPSLPPVEAGSGVLPRKKVFYITAREILRISDNLNLSLIYWFRGQKMLKLSPPSLPFSGGSWVHPRKFVFNSLVS